MSISRWMDKKAVVHIHNGVLLSHKKEYIWISSNEVDETGVYYTEWSKPERKTPIQCTNAYIWNLKDDNNNPVCETAKETQMYRIVFWTLWERVRVGWFGRMALKHVYYHMWNESPVQVWCMIQDLGAGALGWHRGMVWGGRWEGDSGWGTRVHLWRIHVDVWQNQYNIVK